MRSIRRKIDSRDIIIPTHWKKFMDLPENKANLIHLLSTQLMMVAREDTSNSQCDHCRWV